MTFSPTDSNARSSSAPDELRTLHRPVHHHSTIARRCPGVRGASDDVGVEPRAARWLSAFVDVMGQHDDPRDQAGSAHHCCSSHPPCARRPRATARADLGRSGRARGRTCRSCGGGAVPLPAGSSVHPSLAITTCGCVITVRTPSERRVRLPRARRGIVRCMGDDACWLDQTCLSCGRFLEAAHADDTRCPHCGAERVIAAPPPAAAPRRATAEAPRRPEP